VEENRSLKMDSDGEDPIAAFFRGEIVRKRKAPVANYSLEAAKEKKIEATWKRDILEPSTSDKIQKENILLTKYLNATIEEIEHDCTLGIDEEVEEEMPSWPQELQIYKKYPFNLPIQDLPIARKHSQILETINSNKITIIKASTGSGKSSQVPQYILEDAYRKKAHCNILVTQPRRMSAKLLAERVALERQCEVGALVGYQIGLDKTMDRNDTRILYCTTGVFLQKLVHQRSIKNWTHIIIDEIHERDINMDLVRTIFSKVT
jgi:ATP-dependent RNA helicase TDRD9